MNRADRRAHAQRQRARGSATVPAVRHEALWGELIDVDDALAWLLLAEPEDRQEWADQTRALVRRAYDAGPAAELTPWERTMLVGWAARIVLVNLADTRISDTRQTDTPEEWLAEVVKGRNLSADRLAHVEALRAFRSHAWSGLR